MVSQAKLARNLPDVPKKALKWKTILQTFLIRHPCMIAINIVTGNVLHIVIVIYVYTAQVIILH